MEPTRIEADASRQLLCRGSGAARRGIGVFVPAAPGRHRFVQPVHAAVSPDSKPSAKMASGSLSR